MRKGAKAFIVVVYVLLVVLVAAYIVCNSYGLLTFIPGHIAQIVAVWLLPCVLIINAVFVILLSLGTHKKVVQSTRPTAKPVKTTMLQPQKPVATENKQANKDSNSGWLQ